MLRELATVLDDSTTAASTLAVRKMIRTVLAVLPVAAAPEAKAQQMRYPVSV
jgi:hypothetical protein